MKKSLLNYKSLNYGFLLLLLLANSSWSQTVLKETFGAAAVVAPFTGGTSNPSVTYSQTGGSGAVSAVLNGSDAYLSMTSTGANSRPTLTGILPTSGSGLNAILKGNTKLITWSVNIKTNRLGTNGSASYAEGKYFMAVVLCATNNGILGSTTPTGSDGYAIMYQKNSVSTTTGSVSLIKFHNGIGNSSTTADAQELCTATRLIESPALAVIPVTETYAALSVQVSYNPNFDSWQLSYREDPGTLIASPFVDPTSGSLTSAGTIVDNSYTSTPMTNFGFIAGTQTNNAYKFQFDNFQIGLSAPPALGVAKLDLSSFKVYPNPVTNGKLFISSANAVEKQVAIYSILGQKVLDTKTTNNTEINVSKLAKGNYILKITEDGKSEAKKLIIQ